MTARRWPSMLQQRNSGAVISAVEDRIRKLLALADSPNKHEAAAAQRARTSR
ncbi:MAG: DUF2786 domain-containing protein [Solirubrobacteraceae bacterium]